MSKEEKITKFHQFVKTEKGPVNTAVIDLLKGQVYQVSNDIIDDLEKYRYENIQEFMAAAQKAELIIEVNRNTWFPPCAEIKEDVDKELIEKEYNIELHVDEGVALDTVLDKLKNHNVYKVIYYGSKIPNLQDWVSKFDIICKEKNIANCIGRLTVDEEFEPITESMYRFHKNYNSCWGQKMAITIDGKARPCIYSTIELGDFFEDDIEDILEKLEKSYWNLTKNKVEKCKECELKYVCFDCREMAVRNGGELTSSPPACCYDPFSGTWKKGEKSA